MSNKTHLRSRLSDLPNSPGVYLFENEAGEVLYIGKATNLKARVSQYLNRNDSRPHIEFLMKRVHDIRYFATSTPDEALILETDLIKKYRPAYNIKAKDDSGNTHIALDMSKEWPYFEITNFVKPKPGTVYFGPYPSRRAARMLLEAIRVAFPLRSCSDHIFFNRLRPCMEYELGRCLAPCCLNVDKDQYANYINMAVATLKNEDDSARKIVSSKLEQATAELRFEDCILYRDALKALDSFARAEFFHKGSATDFISLDDIQEPCFMCFTRAIGTKIVDITVKPVRLGYDFALEGIIEDHYSSVDELPEQVVLDHELSVDPALVEAFFRVKFKETVAARFADKNSDVESRLIQLTKVNAKHYGQSSFYRRVDYQRLAESFVRELNLSEIPRRVECVDISNLGDKGICAGFSVFVDGEPQRQENIVISLKQRKQNDLNAIRLALKKRVNMKKPLFDLLVVDGGMGHLNVACETLKELGIDRPVVAMAKKREKWQFERIFSPNLSEPLLLKEGSLIHSFFVCLRDEAHRTANRFNRFLQTVSFKKRRSG